MRMPDSSTPLGAAIQVLNVMGGALGFTATVACLFRKETIDVAPSEEDIIRISFSSDNYGLNGCLFEEEYPGRERFEGVSFDLDDVFYVLSLEEAQDTILNALDYLSEYWAVKYTDFSLRDNKALQVIIRGVKFFSDKPEIDLVAINQALPNGIEVDKIVEDRVFVKAYMDSQGEHFHALVIPINRVKLLDDYETLVDVMKKYSKPNCFSDEYYILNRY